MQALAGSAVLWVLLIVVLVVVYMLPTLIGLIRGVDALALVFLVNLIGAPSLIGWPAALILAFGPRRLPPEPAWPLHPGAMRGPAEVWMPGPRDVR
ncbi:MAG TPA: superinfection immunity protein [Streptosporangiaceae bacterium]|nr:superinfection immunity protein [Streptosporangiaceae bacterium]